MNEGTRYVWSIKTIRWNADRGKGHCCEELVTATNFETVLEHLKLDRADTSVEIEAVVRHGPLLKALD